jgi:hypothetical protein
MSKLRHKKRGFRLYFRYFIKKAQKTPLLTKFCYISVGLYHLLMSKEKGVTQLPDVVPGELHGPYLLDVHGVLGHRVHVQLSTPLMFFHKSAHGHMFCHQFAAFHLQWLLFYHKSCKI